jgi:hypothetical protein
VFGRDRSLLDDIEEGALDSRISLAGTLPKCILLGGRAGSVELRTWASRELNGYGADDELPDWRITAAQICVDFNNLRYNVTGQAISPMELPDFARDSLKEEFAFRMGVSAMEDLLKGGDTVKFGIPGGQELLMLINHQNQGTYQHIRSIYWTVSTLPSVRSSTGSELPGGTRCRAAGRDADAGRDAIVRTRQSGRTDSRPREGQPRHGQQREVGERRHRPIQPQRERRAEAVEAVGRTGRLRRRRGDDRRGRVSDLLDLTGS